MASSATSRCVSYISGSRSRRNRGLVIAPSAWATSCRAAAADGRGSPASRSSVASAASTSSAFGLAASAAAAVTARRGSRSSRCGRIRPMAASPRTMASARTAAARTSGASSFSSRSTPGVHRCAQRLAGAFDGEQRPRAHGGRLVVQQQRRDQVPLVERLQHLDRVEHVARVRMSLFLDQRLDGGQVRFAEPQRLRRDVLPLERAAEDGLVLALGADRRHDPRARSSPGWPSSVAASSGRTRC